MTEKIKWTALRDTKEKKGYYKFAKSENCLGTKEIGLSTGDYTIAGLESIFSIERKASTGEFANNITTQQFENELKRGNKLKHFFLLLEFSLENVMNFPYGSGIPNRFWNKLRITPQFMLKRIIEMQVNYNVKVIFAGDGDSAKIVALSILKEMANKYQDKLE